MEPVASSNPYRVAALVEPECVESWAEKLRRLRGRRARRGLRWADAPLSDSTPDFATEEKRTFVLWRSGSERRRALLAASSLAAGAELVGLGYLLAPATAGAPLIISLGVALWLLGSTMSFIGVTLQWTRDDSRDEPW